MFCLERRAWSVFVFGACLTLACGGRSAQSEQGSSANESGGTDAAGGSGGSTSGTGGAPAGGSGGAAAAGGNGGLGKAECSQLDDDNGNAFEEALKCDPNGADDQCTLEVGYGFTCGCDYFVNPANADALTRFWATEADFSAGQCSRYSSGVTCDACVEPTSGHCNASGTCEGVRPDSGRSCKVDGVVYADGDNNVPSPTDVCNVCACHDGKLGCTEKGCDDKPCPEGQKFGQACAECGAADGCELPEYGCFFPCSAGCADRNLLCVNDMCVATACR